MSNGLLYVSFCIYTSTSINITDVVLTHWIPDRQCCSDFLCTSNHLPKNDVSVIPSGVRLNVLLLLVIIKMFISYILEVFGRLAC